MGVLNSDMKRLVERQRLGFVATVCPDGTPNLSPKGTTTVWDDDHLIFADIHSPGSVANLRQNPAVEVNVVDPMVRKGYRFKGTARVLADGELFDEILAFYRKSGSAHTIKHIVLIRVERVLPVVSPAYDSGATEEEVRGRWQDYWRSIERGEPTPGQASTVSHDAVLQTDEGT
jgi:predicted pyridoxine 5'-phosphate oxidase superfamily flavin-nucleotide-binding protein